MNSSVPADLWTFLTARFLVSLAVQIQGMVACWQVYEITKQPLYLGFLGLAEVVPNIAVALYAGHVADRLERRLLAIGAVLTIAVAIFGMAAATYVNPGQAPLLWALYLMTAVGGVGRAFYGPSVFGLLSQICSRDLLPRATAINTTTWQTAAIAGPVLGGWLYVQLHAGATYAASCMLLIVATVLFYSVKSRSEIRVPTGSVRESIMEGLHYVFNHQIILAAMSLDLFGVLFGGAVALLPIFTDEIFHRGPEALGVLRAAPSIGAFLTAAYLTRHPLKKKAGALFMGSVAGFGVCMIAFGLSRDFYFSMFLLALSGMFDAVSIYVRSTIYQLHTPDDMKGRVASVNSIFISSSNEIGEFESGVTAKLMGTVRSVIFGGCATLVVVATTAFKAPKLRSLDLE